MKSSEWNCQELRLSLPLLADFSHVKFSVTYLLFWRLKQKHAEILLEWKLVHVHLAPFLLSTGTIFGHSLLVLSEDL